MSSMVFGRLKLSIFGQSHSAGIGVVIDGLPVGEQINPAELQAFLNRRAPGRNEWSTRRREADAPEFLSGLVNGTTCGAPLCAVIRNGDAHSSDYDLLRDVPRPGHADYAAQVRYRGHQDVSGGGHFSGRLTAPLCIAGGIAKQILARRNVRIGAHLVRVGDACDDCYDPMLTEIPALCGEFPAVSESAARRMQDQIRAAHDAGDSVGGVIECAAVGVPAGVGDPMFDGMENRIARVLFGVPAVKGVEFGAGFEVSKMRGSENNDPYRMAGDGVHICSNHAGGILGGITTGLPIIVRAALKPTPSIARAQESVSLSRKENVSLAVPGRHDPCIAPRAVPCVEAAVAIAVLDAMLENEV